MIRSAVTVLLAGVLFVPGAWAEETPTKQKLEEIEQRQEKMSEELRELRKKLDETREGSRVEEVERKQGILTEELRRVREALVLPERKELKSLYGLGPAASKVYTLERGLSIGGYGEANFKSVVSDRNGADDEFDFLRFVLYTGYKYNDWIVLNSEIEFEHATSGSTVTASDGSVSVEFATLDFLLHPRANVRAGLVLVPVGFLNEIHEPPFFHGNVRPPVETQLIPSTWRSNGFGLFGELVPGLQYRTYGVTSFNADGFRSSGIRGGRQSGNREDADDWSWVGRLDYTMIPEATLGGSVYLGDQGQNESFAGEQPDVLMQLYEVHAQARTHGLELRALGAYIDIDDAGLVSNEVEQTVGAVQLGAYAEAAYDVMPLLWPGTTHYLAPWFRYSWLDTQNDVPSGFSKDRTQRREFYEFGLTYKPIPEVVLKLDTHIQDRRDDSLPDEIRIGGGFVF
jgi:hypothetical protein